MLRDSRITCVAPRFSRSRVVWQSASTAGRIYSRPTLPAFRSSGPFPVGFIAVSDSRGRVRLGPEPGGDPASRRGRSPTSRRGATCLGIDRKPPPCRVGGLSSSEAGQGRHPHALRPVLHVIPRRSRFLNWGRPASPPQSRPAWLPCAISARHHRLRRGTFTLPVASRFSMSGGFSR